MLRKQPQQDRSRALVEAVIEAAARIISRDGMASLTTNRVAAVAGVSVGSLYQYFPNKEALVAEVRRRYDEAFGERFLRFIARAGGLPLRQAVTEWVRLMVELHAQDPRLHNELSAETPDATTGPVHHVVAAYLEAHADEIRRSDPALAAEIMLGAGEGLIHGTALRHPERLADEAFVAEVCELMLRYVARDEMEGGASPAR